MRRITKNVIFLGVVSFFTDVSTEMIFPLLPLFLTDVLNAPASALGVIEGVAGSTASSLKVVSGWLSDRLRKRKKLIMIGYALSAVSKPFFALSMAWWHVLIVRFIDRIGKGIRTSPRDALIADSAERRIRGQAFGIHRGMDTLGAVFGPLLAFLLLSYFDGMGFDVSSAYRSVFWLSFIPATVAVALLFLFVKEIKPRGRKVLGIISLPRSKNFRWMLVSSGLFSLANFSFAFFLLRANDIGISAPFIPLLYLFFNIIYSGFTIPAGTLSDRMGRKPLILSSYVLFSFICGGFAFLSPGSMFILWVLFALYGVFMATFETVQRAFVSDLSASTERGTALGAYHTVIGIGTLPASIVSGALWDLAGPGAAFIYGSIMSLLAALVFLFFVKTEKLKTVSV